MAIQRSNSSVVRDPVRLFITMLFSFLFSLFCAFFLAFFCFGFLFMDSTRKISKHEARGRSCCFPCAAFVSYFQCFCYCLFFTFLPPVSY